MIGMIRHLVASAPTIVVFILNCSVASAIGLLQRLGFPAITLTHSRGVALTV